MSTGDQGAEPPPRWGALAQGEHRLRRNRQPQVDHWAVLVITPHGRLKLGPTQALQLFLERQVVWLNLEELSCRPSSIRS
jgi:hypothetical protein